jgi:hypothetical protein
MDPASLASTITALLVPYLVKVGESLADDAALKLPEQVSKLFSAIHNRFKGRAAAEEAMQDMVARPDDTDNREAFSLQLRKSLKEDEDFASELASLVQVAQRSVHASASGGSTVDTGDVTAGDRGIAVRGDVSGNILIGDRNVIAGEVKKAEGE